MSIFDLKLKDLPLCRKDEEGVLQNYWYIVCDVCKNHHICGSNPDTELPEGWIHEPMPENYYRAVCFNCQLPDVKEPEEKEEEEEEEEYVKPIDYTMCRRSQYKFNCSPYCGCIPTATKTERVELWDGSIMYTEPKEPNS